MINNTYVEMLAYKIFLKQINPNTSKEFTIEDIKKEEYKQPVQVKISELEQKRGEENVIKP